MNRKFTAHIWWSQAPASLVIRLTAKSEPTSSLATTADCSDCSEPTPDSEVSERVVAGWEGAFPAAAGRGFPHSVHLRHFRVFNIGL